MDWKTTPAIALLFAMVLQYSQGQFISAQFALEATAMGSEADADGVANIAVDITITINPATAITPIDIVVTISMLSGGTAQAPGDYNLVRTEVTFDQGANNGNTISTVIDVIDDFFVEGTEIFTISGSVSATGASFMTGQDTAIVTIADNDFPLRVGFELLTYNVDEGDQQEVCAILFAPAMGGSTVLENPVTVTVTSADISASSVSAVDYTAINQALSFPSGAAVGNSLGRQCLFVQTTEDSTPEPDETLQLSLTSGNTAVLGVLAGRGTATVTIQDDDESEFSFQQSTYSVIENVGTTQVCIELVMGVVSQATPVTIVSVAGGTATAPSDFTAVSTTVTFPAGSSSGPPRAFQCAPVTITNDAIVETRFESTQLSASSSAPNVVFTAGGNVASLQIEDDDSIIVGLVPDPGTGTPNYRIPEASGPLQLCAQITNGFLAPGRTAVVTLTTQAGVPPSGASDPQDFGGGAFPLVFTSATGQNNPVCVPAGDVRITNDNTCEADETFSIALSTQAGETQVNLNPQTGTATIIDDDAKTVSFDMPSYTVTEGEDPQLDFSVNISGSPGVGRSCLVTITTVPDSAEAAEDYDASVMPTQFATFSFGSTSPMDRSINIIEDLVFEPTESFNLSLSTSSPDCIIPNPLVPVTILDDEDCTGRDRMPCDENAMCEEFPRRDNFTCTCSPPYTGDGFMCFRISVGDDPHFSIALPSGKLLCYTVQGEHGFVFNLISNKLFHMNAMFVPDSRREEVTWLGSMGIIVQNSQYKQSNATYLRFETKGKKIYIGDKVTLQAKNIEKLSFNKGKMTISEAPPYEGFRYPSVLVDLRDVGLNFTIKFLNEHLDLFWHNTGKHTKVSHGLIGQFFQKGVEIDTVRKILILPGKEPVPVMRRPVWSFMEREVADDQLCWTAMNPGYQGEGLIDGTYFDYLVNDILSTDFKFKKPQ